MSAHLKSWTTQMRKGAAEISVLSLLNQQPLSGIGILDILSEYPDVGIAEGSIYPLLARLERDGRIVGHWVASDTGTRNQKIYNLTDGGKQALRDMSKIWTGFHMQLTKILGGHND